MHYIEKRKKIPFKTLYNFIYLKKERKRLKQFKVGKYYLDKNQLNVIIKEEDATLVIASAGSGKTLTILGKIKYLIKYQNIKEDEILCLSFTKTITQELKEKIKKELKKEVEVTTFHQLGKKILEDNHISFSLVEEDVLPSIIKKYSEEVDLITTFINLYKSNGENPSLNQIGEKIKKMEDSLLKKRCEKLLSFIKIIYEEYKNELRRNNKIDFNDMINEAIKIVDNVDFNYKYIIIDEYQDTSYMKYLLIKKIKEKTNAKLFVVGDDFQSIYRFTGSNLEIFTNFKKYFKYAKIEKITKTYRNSKELVTLAGSFIMKNKYQIKKRVESNIHYKKPVKLFYYEKEEEVINLIKHIDSKDILVLGRNNKDLLSITNIKQMTVHKSKGLESEVAVILNLVDDKLGFPNKVKDDILLSFLKNKLEYPYAEERRLFYVALTRCKKEVYLCTKKDKPSIFIEEIKKNKNVEDVTKKYNNLL